MSEAELRRVREDLDTMRQAAGLELPFDWTDVCWALALVPAGAILSAWAYFGPADSYRFGFVPLVLLALTVGAHRVWKHRRGNLAPSQRRENTRDMTTILVVAAALAGYLIWEKTLGLPGSSGGAVGSFFLGVLCAVGGCSSRAGRVGFAGTVALVPFGLLITYFTGKQMITAVGGLAVMVAGLAAGAILAWQLRRERRNDEPTSH